jgi:hypothetical protein
MILRKYAYLQRRQQGKYNVIQKFFFLHLYQMSLSETSKGELRTLLERDVEPLSDDIIIPKLDVEPFADDNTFLVIRCRTLRHHQAALSN